MSEGERNRFTFPKVDVCGLPITACRTEDVAELLQRAIDKKSPVALAMVNLDFLRITANDPQLHHALRSFDHFLADDWPILALAKRAGESLPERVTGADLTPLICRWASERGWRVGLVGASREVQTVLRKRIPQQYGDILAGIWCPVYRERQVADPVLASQIRAAGADILLVALGCPEQELWVCENLAASGAQVAIGVGARLDFLAGKVSPAPRAWQGARMEWMYRMLKEPRRLTGRYARDAWFLHKAWRRAGARPQTTSGPLSVRMLATMIQGGRGGVYRYAVELARRLEATPDIDLEVECRPEESDLLPVYRQRYTPSWDRGPVIDLLRAQLTARPPANGVLHVPSYRRAPWFVGQRIVVTVHDLAPLHIPEKFGRARHWFLKYFAPQALARCARIIAVTEHTRRDLIEAFGLPEGKITVIPNGIDHRLFRPGDKAAALLRAQTAVPQLRSDFVLYLARIEHPGKGHIPLLEAWARIAQRRRNMPQLVFAGAAVERADEVFARARELGVEVLHTGFLADEVVVDLYRSCLLFVFPSLYEGFGLPPVEAMACGAPVASSRLAALAETAGPAAELQPMDLEQMSVALARLIDGDTERAQLRERGLAWAAGYDWDIAAARTMDVYRSVASQ